MSPPARSWVETPNFSITLAPRPKNRIFRPFNPSSEVISLRNQPEDSGAMMPQSTYWMLSRPYISTAISSPPPYRIQARSSTAPGPTATAERKAYALRSEERREGKSGYDGVDLGARRVL